MGDRVLADSTTLESCSAGAVDVAHSPGGTRLATASSGRNVSVGVDDGINSISVAVYDGGSGSPLWTLTGGFSLPHGARPTKLAWAHPEFGQALAVAADDGTVGIWIEEGGPRVVERATTTTRGRTKKKRLRRWERSAVFEAAGRGTAACLAFAPAAHGPRLAVGWGDGLVRVYVARSPLLGCAAAAAVEDGGGVERLPLPPPAEWELESEFEPSTPALPVTCLCWRPRFAGERGGGEGATMPPMLVVGTAARRRSRQQHGDGGGGGGGNGGTSSVWIYRRPLLRWTRACTLDDGEDADADVDGESSSSSASSDVSAVAWAPAGSARAPERVATAKGASVKVFALAGRADALVAAATTATTTTNAPSSSSSLPLFAQKPAPSNSPTTTIAPEAVLRHSAAVWRLDWAPLGGGWLAAGTDAGAVVLWRQNLRGEWGPQSAIVAEESGGGGGGGDGTRTKLASSTVQQDATGLATVVV